MRINGLANSMSLLSIVLLCLMESAIAVAQGQHDVQFRINTQGDWRFLTIIATGNKDDRKAHVSIYEILRPDFRLRRFQDIELVNSYSPMGLHLSYEGRFVVTVDDMVRSKDPAFAFVIYDLIRKEQTIHKLGDLFTETEIRDYSGRLSNGWERSGGEKFNQRTQEFYVTSPDIYTAYLPSQSPPFVIIDLQTRAVRVEPEPIIGNKLSLISDPRGWKGTRELKWNHGQVPPVLLPPQLEYHDELGGLRTYKLDESTKEYSQISYVLP
jgi:hypothetical protein